MRLIAGLMLCGLLFPPVAGAENPGLPRIEHVAAPLLIDSGGCRGCHRIDGRGGSVGPDLAGVGRRLSRERLRRQLLEPRQLDAATVMPSYNHLSPAELELLLDFLSRQ